MVYSGVYKAVYNALYQDPYGVIGSAAAWTPATLFASGEQGVWYDPSDLSTLYQDAAGTTPVTAVEQPVGKMLDKSGRGNHASQPTAASRPVLSARKNLLTKTEDFSDGVWSPVDAKPAVAVNVATSPRGDMTADKWTPAAVSGTYGCVHNSVCPAGQYTFIVYAKNAGYNRIGIRAYDGTSYFLRGTIDLTTGMMVADGSQAGSWSVASAGGGWWKITCTATSVGAFSNLSMEVLNTTLVQSTWTPNGTDGIYVWGAHLQSGAGNTYQRVNTATDYDTVGFPLYAKTDGVDDFDSSASGGGSSTAFFLCQAIQVNGGAGTARTIFSDAGTNTGYIVRVNASNQLELAAGNGTAYTTVATAGTLAVGTTNVITAWDDGTNLNVQIGNGTVASVARPVVVAGTAAITRFKDNGVATSFLACNNYGTIYRKDASPSADERLKAKTYLAEKAGVTLP